MSIVALDRRTVKFLTTAQVVTSVSTAVKELVENAIDARAKSIEIKLIDNGASLIEVSDDGTGISKFNAEFMALQSYTSKIRDFTDLDTLESYGFRGEALSSLCKVADVTVITKTREDEAARCYRMNHDGGIENFELCHNSIGTTIRAKSMFKDFPVRRQMLTCPKRSSQDLKTLENLLRSFAICQPDIRLTLRVDGRVVLTKGSSATRREALTCIYGNKFVSQIDFVDTKVPEVTIQLAIPKKECVDFQELCQAGQYTFVNRRPIFYKNMEKVMNKRLADHFGDKIPVRKKLFFFLNLNVPSADLDVNLEPNKITVLLVNQAKIVERLDKLLVKYYDIMESSSEIGGAIDVEVETSTEYHDCTSSKVSRECPIIPPSCKKRRMAAEDDECLVKDSGKSDVPIADGENRSTNVTKNLFPEFHEEYDEETMSQLPIVDLGPDFGTQEIKNLPSVDSDQIETILGKTSDEINSSVTKMRDTDEAWSKGRVSTNLHGGTDVEIYGNRDEIDKSKNDSAESNSSSTACKGFLRFSKESRRLIIAENPGINFVETAKALTARWKALSSEERGYYRDLAESDKESGIRDSCKDSGRCSKQKKIKCENANRARFLNMLESMKNTKLGSKTDNAMRRTVVPWTMSIESLKRKFFVKRSNDSTGNRTIVLGTIDGNVWLARTGCQIWALDSDQLSDGLCLERLNRDERTRESVEELVRRWLNEKEGMALLQPVFEL